MARASPPCRLRSTCWGIRPSPTSPRHWWTAGSCTSCPCRRSSQDRKPRRPSCCSRSTPMAGRTRAIAKVATAGFVWLAPIYAHCTADGRPPTTAEALADILRAGALGLHTMPWGDTGLNFNGTEEFFGRGHRAPGAPRDLRARGARALLRQQPRERHASDGRADARAAFSQAGWFLRVARQRVGGACSRRRRRCATRSSGRAASA